MIPELQPVRSRPPLPNTQPASCSAPCLSPLPQHPLHLLTQAVSKAPHWSTGDPGTPPPARAPPNSHRGPRGPPCQEYHMLFRQMSWEGQQFGRGLGVEGWMRRSGARDAFARGDASRLSIQAIHRDPKLRRRLGCYRIGTDDKMHLKCQEGVQRGGGQGGKR